MVYLLQNVIFDGLARHSRPAAASCDPEWVDGDFAFEVTHYFGQAPIKVQLCVKDMLGSVHCIGQASLTLGEVVAAHQSRLAQLAAPSPAELDSQLGIHSGWLHPGDDPLIHRVTLPLQSASGKPGKGTVTIAMAFFGGVLFKPLGPLKLNRLHRAAAGGMADLLRHMLRTASPGTKALFVAASSGLNPADYAAQGATMGHYQCLILLAHMQRTSSINKNLTKREYTPLCVHIQLCRTSRSVCR